MDLNFSKYLFKILFLAGSCLPLPATAQSKDKGSAKADTAIPDSVVVMPKQKAPKEPYLHQIRVGADISRIAFNFLSENKQAYEFQADYALRGKSYLAAEAGFGRGKVNYDNLRYNTDGGFIRLGIDNSILDRLGPSDFDMAFIGARYGFGMGNRSEASYKVSTVFGGSTEGTVPAKSYSAHWGEILAGIKVELWKGLFAGWTVRAKFLFNSGSFKELAPNFIPGYGPGDKSTAFDFNMYLSYSIRWMATRGAEGRQPEGGR